MLIGEAYSIPLLVMFTGVRLSLSFPPKCLREEKRFCLWVRVKVPHTSRYKIGHFGDVLPSQSLALVLKKLNLTQHNTNNTRTKQCKLNQKNTQNAEPKPKPTVIFRNCSCVCVSLVQLSYTTKHRTDLMIFPLILQTVVIAQKPCTGREGRKCFVDALNKQSTTFCSPGTPIFCRRITSACVCDGLHPLQFLVMYIYCLTPDWIGRKSTRLGFVDFVQVWRPTPHKTGHFEDVLPSQSRG